MAETQEQHRAVFIPAGFEDADFEDLNRDPRMEEENAAFEQFKAEMHEASDDATITVTKRTTDANGQPIGKAGYQCFACGVNDYTFSQLCARIRDEYGTGLYKLQGRDSKGKYKFERNIGIQAPIDKNKKTDSPDLTGFMDRFAQVMERQQARTEQMLANVMPNRNGGTNDTLEMIKAMAGMFAAMGFQPPQQQSLQAPKSLVEQLTEFKLIRELMGDLSGGRDGGGEANLYSLLGETVKAFGGPIAAALAAGAQSGELDKDGIARRALPAPEKTEMSEEDKQKAALKKNIAVLIQNAKLRVPPTTFADILLANTPAEKEDELWNFISDENCVAAIIKLDPAAAPYKEWFDALREAIIERMTEPDDEPEEEAGDEDLTSPENGSKVATSGAVAGEDENGHDGPDEGDTGADT